MPDHIESIRAYSVELPLVADFVTSRKKYTSLPYVITEIISESGLRGYGEAREAVQITGETLESILGLVNSHFAPAIKGMNPFDIEAIHDTMNTIFNMKMVSAPLRLKSSTLGGGIQMAQDYGREVAGLL